MNLSHRQAQKLLQKSLQAQLDAAESEALADHLEQCDACAQYQAAARALDRRLAESLTERWPERRAAPDRIDRSLASIHSRMRRESMVRKFSSAARFAGAVAMLVVLVAGLAWFSRSFIPRPAAGGPSTATPYALLPQVEATYTPYESAPVVQATFTPYPGWKDVNIYFFWGANCPECGAAGAFLDRLAEQYPVVHVRSFDADQPENAALLEKMLASRPAEYTGLPAIFIGPDYWSGYNDAAAQQIGQAMTNCISNGCPDAGQGILPVERIGVDRAESLVREWIFANNPDMNPEAAFPLVEITPDEAWERLGAQVFKVKGGVKMYESFVIYAGQVYPIGIAFGGMGVSDMAVIDLDANGQPELFYTYSFGSGVHQSSAGIFFVENGTAQAVEAAGYRFLGDLAIEKQDDQTVFVLEIPAGQSSPEGTGQPVQLAHGRLLIGSEAAVDEYASERFGVSFLVPAGWQPDGEDAMRGGTVSDGDGFFSVTPVDSWAGDLYRACEWEANSSPALYGSAPQIQPGQLDEEHEICLIQPSFELDGAQTGAVFRTADGSLVVLRTSPAHFQLILGSLRFFDGGAAAEPQEPAAPPAFPPAEERLVTFSLGELTLTEYAAAPEDADAPTHMEFNQRIPDEIFAARDAWRDVQLEQQLESNNQILAVYGYRLEKTGDQFALYQGERLVMDGLQHVYPAANYLNESGGGDFALIVENQQGQWLARKDSLTEWDPMLHHYTRPIFAGERLITVESSPEGAGTLLVRQDGETIFRYVSFFGVVDPVKRLDSWDGGWLLEVNGTLIHNGENLNLKEGYSEAFNFTMLNGKPFYFFTRDGKINAWYGGKILPMQYDEVVHDKCCEPAIFNIENSPDSLWFYAKRDGVWHFVGAAAD